MSKGYIVIAQNNDTVDYLEQAYALALNLKLTQSTVSNLTVCVDAKTKKLITAKHKKVFDKIVDIPWQDDASDAVWKINNKWKYYYMSPYDETVILDTDMLFLLMSVYGGRHCAKKTYGHVPMLKHLDKT